MSIKYSRFKTEDELLKSVMRSSAFDKFPKVSAIGGKKINPDIDILQILNVSQGQSRLIGYEAKLIKFDSRSGRLSWNSFYNGIGQALLYLKNGVHRAAVIFGFHENVRDDSLIEGFNQWLWDNKDILKRILGDHVSISIHLYDKGNITPTIEAGSDFYHSDEKIQLLSNELLQGKFTFNRRLKNG